MSYTETQVINRISTVLQDTGTAIWGAAEIRQCIDDALVEIAEYSPYVVLATVTTSEGTKDVDISTITDALWIDQVEFREDKNPKRFRNFTIRGSKLSMNIDFLPSASENVRLYCAKAHVLSGTTTNTLDPREEQILIDLAAGHAAVNKGRYYINKVPVGSGRPQGELILWGQTKVEQARQRLQRISQPRCTEEWPRDA